MGKIVLDNHNNEVFNESSDIKLLTAEELTNGIDLWEFEKLIIKAKNNMQNVKK